MKTTHLQKILILLFLLLIGIQTIGFAQDEDLYNFDVDEFEKKIWEWKGMVSFSATSKTYNQDSVIYPSKFPNNESGSNELELSLALESRWDWEWSRLFIAGEVSTMKSSISENDEDDSVLSEAYWQLAELEPHNFEIGKRLLRWGKGYAFNPVALMERVKNPEDPEASREGLWTTQAIWITGALAGFETTSINLVYLPIREDINDDYQTGVVEDDIWGFKLYGLIGTTDIDIYAVAWEQEEVTQWGFDFATNLSVNFEIHGEYVSSNYEEFDRNEALLGLRYLTDTDVTWIAEIYSDSEGLTAAESEILYENIENSQGIKKQSYLSQIQQRKTINQNYGYIKVSVKEPFNWLYFTPSFSWLGNLDDQSSNISTQMSYTPSDNWIMLLTWQHMTGRQYTQYGENVVQDKLALLTSFSF
jgi:hypothetical protein